jgi:uncharacterized membrane protein
MPSRQAENPRLLFLNSKHNFILQYLQQTLRTLNNITRSLTYTHAAAPHSIAKKHFLIALSLQEGGEGGYLGTLGLLLEMLGIGTGFAIAQLLLASSLPP